MLKSKLQRAAAILASIGLAAVFVGASGHLRRFGYLDADSLFFAAHDELWFYYAARGGAAITVLSVLIALFGRPIRAIYRWVLSGE